MPDKIKCPDCGSTRVSKLYCTPELIIYCQNGSHKGFHAYKTTYSLSKGHGKTFVKVHWDYEPSDDESDVPVYLKCQGKGCNRDLKNYNQKYCSIKCKNRAINYNRQKRVGVVKCLSQN